jgi:tRNA-dihydrouridine synthase B
MHIGSLNIPGPYPLALAPMDDVTDVPFRRLAKRFGADLVCTEFVQSSALIRGAVRPGARLRIEEGERPVGVQIYGSDPDLMAEAARIAQQARPDFVDINGGCCNKRIAGRGDGAGLLRDLLQFEAVVKAVVAATALPVTVKIRLGWDDSSINVLDAARMVEQSGASALAVHCRTFRQAYGGQAAWSWLDKVRRVITIPLLGNGDVRTPEDARRMLETGCDGVMIGRGAIGNPWIFQQTKHFLAKGDLPDAPTPVERIRVCLEHFKDFAAYAEGRRAVFAFRKYYRGYLVDVPNGNMLWKALMDAEESEEVEELVIERLASFD